MVSRSTRLKLIVRIGATRGHLDEKKAEEMGVEVRVLPHAGNIAVAEHTLLLILALSRRLLLSDSEVRKAAYPPTMLPSYTTQNKWAYNWLCIQELRTLFGKKLGLIGLGEIGTQVARRAHAFGMKVYYFKRHRLSREKEQELSVSFLPLVKILQRCDYVSVHVPHTNSTERMLGSRELSLMKRTAFLINTARGNVIDEKALVRELEAGKIAGAGLDVFSLEPIPKKSPLLQLGNVVLTPHVAWGDRREILLLNYDRAFRVISEFVLNRD